jgi:hypothetical protein
VNSMATKHANKSFLSRLGGFFPHFSLWVEGWLWIGWVVGFGWFECFLLFMVAGARNKLRVPFSSFSHISQSQHPIYMWIWLHSPQPDSDHAQSSSHSTWFSQDMQSNKRHPT